MVEEAFQGVAALHGTEVVKHHGDEPVGADLQGTGHDLELCTFSEIPMAQGEKAFGVDGLSRALGLQHGQDGPAVGTG